MIEHWRPITSAPGYEVSDLGRVRRGGRILINQPHRGYLRVQLWIDGSPRTVRVHRLVCEEFNGPPPFAGAVVGHVNNDKQSNRPANLAWMSQGENIRAASVDGLMPAGERCGAAKLTDAAVREIRSASKYYGYSRDLAARFGVAPVTIQAIRHTRATWKHVEGWS